MAFTRSSEIVAIGSVSIGATFVFQTAEILGCDCSEKKPPYEGQVLTVVGFRPRLKNNVVVQETNGGYSLMPLWMAERALSLQATQQVTTGRARQ
jgi:hypothetical protein